MIDPALVFAFQEAAFWPDNAGEWVTILTLVVGFIGAVAGGAWRIGKLQAHYEESLADLKREGEERLKRHGERLGQVESVANSAISEINNLQLIDRGQTYQIDTNARETGRLDGRVSMLEGLVSELMRDNIRIEGAYRERLAVFERDIEYLQGAIRDHFGPTTK